jgi:hypothetical protein
VVRIDVHWWRSCSVTFLHFYSAIVLSDRKRRIWDYDIKDNLPEGSIHVVIALGVLRGHYREAVVT